ncbi:MAG: hypothetical protein JSV04_11400 [Candidatus Heimdallarchaeota archaeon]|nr:MAG: hypothetical protein JSV04_11400 [Candidatus Heimdallarchaeota archaeon]
METLDLPQTTLEWLLDDDNPPVRNLTKKHLLNQNPTDSEIQQINDYPPIKKILSLMNPNGSWSDPTKPYRKYVGSYWQFIFLCDLNANPMTDYISKAAEHIFSYQLPNGDFPHELRLKKGIICLTANLLRSLIHFGYEEDPRVQNGIKLVTRHIIDNQGVFCFDQLGSLLPDCQMALTKVLAMYVCMTRQNLQNQTAIEIIEKKIVENRVLYYVPKGSTEYQKAIKGKKVTEVRQIKAQMQKQSEKLKKTEIKSSWKRFGFPHSYTSDTLETMYWLAMNNSQYHEEFKEALELVIKRMDPSGYWINENKFRNPMLVEIEPKKTPSKWLTFRACYILRKYWNLRFQD